MLPVLDRLEDAGRYPLTQIALAVFAAAVHVVEQAAKSNYLALTGLCEATAFRRQLFA